jgi:hypothetical protein
MLKRSFGRPCGGMPRLPNVNSFARTWMPHYPRQSPQEGCIARCFGTVMLTLSLSKPGNRWAQSPHLSSIRTESVGRHVKPFLTDLTD